MKNSNLHIAVTGSDGFLGNVLIRKLLFQGHRIKALQLKENDVLPTHPNLTIQIGDVRNLDDIMELCKDTDLVIHCASYISIVNYEKPLLEAINVGGLQNILQSCKAQEVKKLIYISSVEAIGKSHSGIHSEKEGFNPKHTLIPYGASKARAANITLEFSQEYGKSHNCVTTIMCPAGIVGPYDFGSSTIGDMAQKFLQKKLSAYPAKGGFCFVDVRDTAEAIIQGIEKADNGEVFVLSGKYLAVSEMMDLLEQASGIPKPKTTIPLWFLFCIGIFVEAYAHIFRQKAIFTTGSVRVLRSCLEFSSKKMQDVLGVVPRPMSDTFKDQVLWYQNKTGSLE